MTSRNARSRFALTLRPGFAFLKHLLVEFGRCAANLRTSLGGGKNATASRLLLLLILKRPQTLLHRGLGLSLGHRAQLIAKILDIPLHDVGGLTRHILLRGKVLLGGLDLDLLSGRCCLLVPGKFRPHLGDLLERCTFVERLDLNAATAGTFGHAASSKHLLLLGGDLGTQGISLACRVGLNVRGGQGLNGGGVGLFFRRRLERAW